MPTRREEQLREIAQEARRPQLGRDPDALRHLVHETRKFTLLSEKEEHALVRRYQEEGDTKAGDALINSHVRLVLKVASGYRGYEMALEDLVAEGNIGLVEALRRFDLDKGVRFSTYALWWIKAHINEFVMRNFSMVRIGTTAAQKKLFFGLQRERRALGIQPHEHLSGDLAERIADQMAVNTKDVLDMDVRLRGPDYSVNAPVREEGEGEWGDWLEDESALHETQFVADDEKLKRMRLAKEAFAILSPRELQILTLRRLREPALTLELLSQKLGISRERVRQIEAEALGKLQKRVQRLSRERNLNLN
ncbi:MAG: RNA polymerase factor sigma-32 [Holosporales bacterium]